VGAGAYRRLGLSLHGHWRRTPMIALDLQGVISYISVQRSVVGTVVEL